MRVVGYPQRAFSGLEEEGTTGDSGKSKGTSAVSAAAEVDGTVKVDSAVAVALDRGGERLGDLLLGEMGRKKQKAGVSGESHFRGSRMARLWPAG